MADASTTPSETGFLQLVFSASGATIAVCVAIVVVAVIIFLLSRRFPQISLQYGSSKLELKRDSIATEAQHERAGVASDIPTTIGTEKEAAAVLAGVDSQDDFGNRHYELMKAVENQDRSQIEKVFDSLKIKPIGYAPYQLDVWKNAELLRAGFADARTELERIERENPKDSDASRALVRYYLGIRATEQARIHVDILLARAVNDEKLATAALLKLNISKTLKTATRPFDTYYRKQTRFRLLIRNRKYMKRSVIGTKMKSATDWR